MALEGKMTTQQAADFLGIDRSNLLKKLNDGLIPYERHGWAYVLDVKDVEAFHERFPRFSHAKRLLKARQQ